MAETLNKKTLFICDLDNTITESQLRQAFKEEGYAVNYIRINKSKYPGGLNTAFVNFENESDAAKALETLNHLTLGATELYIVYATNKPTGTPFHYDAKKTVFVKNVPKNIETIVLIRIFSSVFGEVTNLRIMRTSKNESRGYGYITFKNEEDAKKAIDHDDSQEMKFEINGTKHSFTFEFHEYKNKEDRELSWTNTYIKDYPTNWNDAKLKEFAEKVGPTRSVVHNYKKELDFVYGFANFVNHADALKFRELHNKQIYEDTLLPVENDVVEEGRKVFVPYIQQYVTRDVRLRQLQGYKQNGCGLFITNFPSDIKLSDINREFSKFGTIFSSTLYEKSIHEILPGADPRFPRALVLFSDKESATKAIAGKNGSDTINGKKLPAPIYVDSYQSRGGNTYSKNMRKMHGNQAPNPRSYGNYNQRPQNNINNYPTSSFFDNEYKYNGASGSGKEYTTQLEEIISNYLTANSPDNKDKLPKILEIFTQMFNEEEIQSCVANQSHISEYITAILSEM